jgi:hypothetical protein
MNGTQKLTTNVMNAALQKQKPTQQKHKKLEEEIECSKHLQAPKKKKTPQPNNSLKSENQREGRGGKKKPSYSSEN